MPSASYLRRVAIAEAAGFPSLRAYQAASAAEKAAGRQAAAAVLPDYHPPRRPPAEPGSQKQVIVLPDGSRSVTTKRGDVIANQLAILAKQGKRVVIHATMKDGTKVKFYGKGGRNAQQMATQARREGGKEAAAEWLAGPGGVVENRGISDAWAADDESEADLWAEVASFEIVEYQGGADEAEAA